MLISIHTGTGIPTSPPMQIGVTINGKTLLTLLHSVSTHNFINAKTLHSLNLPIEPVSKRIKSDSGQWRLHIECWDLSQSTTISGQRKIPHRLLQHSTGKLWHYIGDKLTKLPGTNNLGLWKLTMKFWRQGRPILWTGYGRDKPSLFLLDSNDKVERCNGRQDLAAK